MSIPNDTSLYFPYSQLVICQCLVYALKVINYLPAREAAPVSHARVCHYLVPGKHVLRASVDAPRRPTASSMPVRDSTCLSSDITNSCALSSSCPRHPYCLRTSTCAAADSALNHTIPSCRFSVAQNARPQAILLHNSPSMYKGTIHCSGTAWSAMAPDSWETRCDPELHPMAQTRYTTCQPTARNRANASVDDERLPAGWTCTTALRHGADATRSTTPARHAAKNTVARLGH